MVDRRRFRIDLFTAQWLYDRAVNNWPWLIAVFGGGGLMSILTAATSWLNSWGPVAWGAAFFAGAFIALGLVWLAFLAQSLYYKNKFAKRAFASSEVNLRDDEFNRDRINLPDFFNPYYIAHRNKTFTDCQIWGPALVYFQNGMLVTDVTFRSVQIVIANDDAQVRGAVAFEDCRIIGGEICNVTLIMSQANYNALPPEMRQHVPVISGGR